MTTAALIDTVIKYADSVDSADADNTGRRARVLQYAQEVFDEVWHFREWRFRIKSATLTVPASGTVAAPADFLEIGEHGGIYSGTERYVEVFPQEMQATVQSGLGQGTYALYGQSTAGVPQFQFQPAAATLLLYYNKLPPTLVDTTGETNNLFAIPVAYHNTVLVPGTIVKTKRSKGDLGDWPKEFQRGLGFMTLRERPRKSTVQRMPKAVLMQW